ncbi:MAG: amidohydrolase family protein [Bacteroidota bacterium]
MKKIVFILLLAISTIGLAQIDPQNGLKPTQAPSYALTNATIVVSSIKTIDKGTLLIENGKIVEVGSSVSIPKGTITIDCSGKFIFPAFIESYSSVGVQKPARGPWNPSPQIETSKKGPYYWNESIHPEINASELYLHDQKSSDLLLNLGFGFALTHQEDGIARGSAALVALGDNGKKQIIVANAAQVFSFEKGASNQTYPSSQMGSIALLRQYFYDAQWFEKNNPQDVNLSLSAQVKNKNLPILFATNDKWELFRAQKIADEFGLNFQYLGSGNEYQALDNLKALKNQLILPINFPSPFDVKDPYLSRQIPLSDLKHWELAPANPHAVLTAGGTFSITSKGIAKESDFWKNIRKIIEMGVTKEQALAALTENPAKWLQQEKSIGTLEKGKLASFSIYSSNPFTEESKLLETWTLGKQQIQNVINQNDISGNYNVNLEGHLYPLQIAGSIQKPEGKITFLNPIKDEFGTVTKKDSIVQKTALEINNNDIIIQFTIEDDFYKGNISLHGKMNLKLGVFEGDALLPTGKMIVWSAVKNSKIERKKDSIPPVPIDTLICQRIWFPNVAYGFDEKAVAETIVFKNVTVWTNEDAGNMPDATVVVENGKIKFVGNGTFTIPTGAKVIDGKGKHLTSGIIDEHSHIAISKGVNEGGQAISAEVNIGTVLDADDINIYRQLAGGVTAAQLLHGSANPIGGQSALIKLKWGVTPDELLIPNAPKFIKFALGENVKQANWGDFQTVRFPQTRMGVEQVFYDGFHRAREYEKASKANPDIHRDLELDVLLEILNSQRFITCHSYVQSEINMLLHVADSMKFRLNTFTHILEGYKVADKMKKHGAGASTFSDWWAYKYEVNDAIPYNAGMMQEQGLVVAINSDDAEMGRRLNQEAAKSVKYSDMSEIDAWKMVTLNPAKLLHLDDRMGSIKAGKDADLVLWSDNPLSIMAKSEMTIVDGVVMYDKVRDEQMRYLNQEEKARIINKMLESNEKGEPSKAFKKKARKFYHCDTIGEEGSEETNHH